MGVRSWRRSSDDSGFLHTFTSVTSHEVAGLPAPAKGIVRAENLPGCGMRWTVLPSSTTDGSSDTKNWLMEIALENDPKGWLPASVVNSAMTMQFTDQARGTKTHFGNLPMSADAP